MQRTRPEPLDVASLFACHRDGLLIWFTRRTADAEIALDLWAETFACAVAGSRKFRGTTTEHEAAWLYGIARNQLALYYRRGQAEQRALKRLGIDQPAVTDELLAEIEQRADLEELRAALSTATADLSGAVAQAVDLRVVQELPYAEIATRLQINEQAARARVSRGLALLADAMTPDTVQEVEA